MILYLEVLGTSLKTVSLLVYHGPTPRLLTGGLATLQTSLKRNKSSLALSPSDSEQLPCDFRCESSSFTSSDRVPEALGASLQDSNANELKNYIHLIHETSLIDRLFTSYQGNYSIPEEEINKMKFKTLLLFGGKALTFCLMRSSSSGLALF